MPRVKFGLSGILFNSSKLFAFRIRPCNLLLHFSISLRLLTGESNTILLGLAPALIAISTSSIEAASKLNPQEIILANTLG